MPNENNMSTDNGTQMPEMTSTPELPDGITSHDGADAAAVVRRAERTAAGEGESLDGLAERIRTENNPSLALDPLMVALATELQKNDAPAFDLLGRDLKAAGVGLTSWRKAIDAHARETRRAEKESARRAMAADARRREEERERARIEREAQRQREREAADHELAAHYADRERDGATVSIVPGSITRTTLDRRGEEKTITLAGFSARIVTCRNELSAPGVSPESTYILAVVVDGERAARPPVEVPAREWRSADWPENRIGALARVSAGAGVRDQLREAVELLSDPVVTWRFGFTGWTNHGGSCRYVTPGVSLGAEGAVVGVDVAVQGIAAKYTLAAPLEGPALHDALESALSFVRLSPESVTVPLFGAVFRAALGPSKATVHVTGRPGLGKTLLCTIVSRFFGVGVEALSWADGSTANGIMHNLRTVGDALVVVDDLRVSGTGRDEAAFRLADHVIRAQFNRAAPSKGKREGGLRDTSASRCLLVSTGETIPASHSGVWRMISLEIENKVDIAAVVPILRAAERGELAGVMARFIVWLAPRMTDLREHLADRERAAAVRAGIDPQERTGMIAAELALGLDTFAEFLADVAPTLAGRFDLAAARATLAAVVAAQGAIVAGEDPARRFGPLLGEALRAGAAHVVAVKPDGRMMPPDSPSLWGWRDDGGWKRQGPCIGYVRGGDLAIEPGPALRVARDLAQRTGRPLPLEERTLGRDLFAAGVLARSGRDAGRGTHAVQFRIGAGVKISALSLKPDALGMTLDGPVQSEDPTDDGLVDAPTPTEPTSTAPAEPFERVEV